MTLKAPSKCQKTDKDGDLVIGGRRAAQENLSPFSRD